MDSGTREPEANGGGGSGGFPGEHQEPDRLAPAGKDDRKEHREAEIELGTTIGIPGFISATFRSRGRPAQLELKPFLLAFGWISTLSVIVGGYIYLAQQCHR